MTRELHPELERALREWVRRFGGTRPHTHPIEADLTTAIAKHLPQPSFGERVLEFLPEGWEVEENDDWPYDDEGKRPRFRWAFKPPDPWDWCESFCINESLDPKAVADALLLLSGEKR